MRNLLRLILLVALAGCASTTAIVHDADELDANQIIVYLASRGITATKTVSAPIGAGATQTALYWDISVPAEQSVEAMAILDKLGLPRPRATTLLDLFSTSGIVPSERQETIRYQLGLAGQIASTIRSMDGILDCQVQLALPEEGSKTPPRASVFVKHLGIFDDPNNQLGSKIRRLVAGSVPGLEYDNVTLVPDRARYVDIALAPSAEQLPEMRKEYAKVLGVVVSADSVAKLRLIVSAMIVGLLILLGVAIFLAWRLLPGVRKKKEPPPEEPPAPIEELPPPPSEPGPEA